MVNARSKDDLQSEVIAWLREELDLAAGKAIGPSTSVNFDLGVDGDDGYELIKAFSARFDVDTSVFPLSHHFGSEAGANPFSLLWSLVRMLIGKHASSLKPLYVSDLVQLAVASSKDQKL